MLVDLNVQEAELNPTGSSCGDNNVGDQSARPLYYTRLNVLTESDTASENFRKLVQRVTSILQHLFNTLARASTLMTRSHLLSPASQTAVNEN